MLELFTYNAFPTPITQAVPVFQPLVPSPDCVRKVPACVCFLRLNSIQNTAMNPQTESKSVACANFGTDRGARKSGAALTDISGRLVCWIVPIQELACYEHGSKIYQVYLPRGCFEIRVPEVDEPCNGHGAEGYTRASDDPPSQQCHPTYDEGGKFLVLGRC